MALLRMTTASGSRVVDAPRETVWRALAVLEPYCAVCDVSYVVSGKPGVGTTFVAAPGRLEGRPPREGSPRGEILEWVPKRAVTTRLSLTPETWTTRIQLTDAGEGTQVTITLIREPARRNRVVERVQRNAMQRLVQRMVDTELDKVPAHIAQAAEPAKGASGEPGEEPERQG